MVPLMMAIIQKVKSMELVSSPGPIRANIMVTLSKTTSKVKESMNGLTAESTKESGKITKWKVLESSTGLMIVAMKVIMLMTKRKAMVSSTGLMVVSMMALG